MTEVEPRGMSHGFGQVDAPRNPALLESTLCRDEARNSMRRTSSAGDIPRTWKGNMEIAATDLLSMRRGSATSNGTATSSQYSSKDTDVTDIVSQLGPWRSLVASSKGPFAVEAGESSNTNGQVRNPRQPPSSRTSPPSSTLFPASSTTASASTRETAVVQDKPSYVATPAKKPLRSVLRRPSSPSPNFSVDAMPPSPVLRSEPALNTNAPFRHDDHHLPSSLLHEHRRSLIAENARRSDSESDCDMDQVPTTRRNVRKTSAPEALNHRRSTSATEANKLRPKSAEERKSSDGDIDFEPRVSFSTDTGAPPHQSNASGSDDSGGGNFSEGQRKAFSAFMGQTRKHSGAKGTTENMTVEEVRGMRIFLEQCQKRRNQKSPQHTTTTTGSDDEISARSPVSSAKSLKDTKKERSDGERSEILDSYSSLNRKRARSSNATYTTTKQTHISNMSIFKSRPDGGQRASNDFSVTIVAEHPIASRRSSGRDDEDEHSNGGPSVIEGSSDDVDDVPSHPARKSSGSIRTRKLYLNTEGAELAGLGSVTSVVPGSLWRPGRIRASVASTIDNGNNGRRASETPIRSPWMKAVRLPPRWLSLRNAMAVTNVIIITLAIVIITVVSYVSSRDTAAMALDTLGTIALKSIALSIGGALARAEDKNGDTATAVIVYGLRPDSLQCPSFFWSNARRDTSWSGDQFYMVDEKGSFCGLLSTEFPGFENFDERGVSLASPADALYTLRVANGTAPAPRYAYSLNNTIARNCPDLAVPQCVADLVQSPERVTDIYDATQRPYYKLAVANSMGSWTSSYNLGSGDGYGFTNVLPVHTRLSDGNDRDAESKPPLLAIAAVDIHLGSLSDYLRQSLSALFRALDTNQSDILWGSQDVTTNSIQFLIADMKTDSIIASTCPGLTGTGQQNAGEPPQPDNPPRPYSSLTSDSCFGNLASAVGILSALPTEPALIDGNVKVLSSPIRIWSESSLTMAARYTPREGLEWAIVGRIPGQYFHIKLGDIYTLTIPLTAALVLVASALGSFLITRAIGRPLKRAAEKMMRIADLNFDEDPVETEQESDMEHSDLEAEESAPRRWSLASLRFKWSSDQCGNTGANRSSETVVRRSFFLSPRSVSRSTTSRRRGSAASHKRKAPPFVLKEIQLLNTAMDAMTSGLKSFSKYVPLDVVALLVKMKREAVLGVDEMSLSIFFSDIANFTTIAESMSPQQLVLVMSEYLSEMSSIILESQGIVDKFIGDVSFSIFNAGLSLKERSEGGHCSRQVD
ncbi:hypothetical protein DFJ77DRAFT_28338 [Powellomyces hirtus]|nr:hypothetical protein DFJ77DRAFT_28338 [Powellomyces hirtus]